MSDLLPLPTDQQIHDSITNIAQWLQSHSHTGPQETPEEICAEDLAIAVPGECLFPELSSENEEATRDEEKGILVYTDSNDDKFIWISRRWHTLDRVLNITVPKTGWQQTESLGERFLLLVLTQLDYAAKESEAEVPYGCCPLTDPGYLLWLSNRPRGMCSIKRKGTSIWGGEDVYACDTLDTLYVRPCARRQGHTMALLRTLTSQLPPGDHFGLSHPVSLSMCKVLLKFIQVYPELRETLWTLDEDGEVSGPVLLMLGSLMMRGALQAPPQPQQPQRALPQQSNYKFHADGQMIVDKIQETKLIPAGYQSKSPCQIAMMSQGRPEIDEPCDTS